jgi:putative transposase
MRSTPVIRDGQVANRPIYVALAVTVDGKRDILGLWAGDGGEGAKYWLQILTEIKSRGVADVCIVHLLRASFGYAARQHWDAIARALKPVYTAPTAEAAEDRFGEFAQAWGEKYPAIVRLWENSWAEFVPFLQFDAEIRRVVCSTNAIESAGARIRKAVRARGHFRRRAGRTQVRLPGGDEPGPHRQGPQTLDHPLEARPQRLRGRLRRPTIRRPPILSRSKVSGLQHSL